MGTPPVGPKIPQSLPAKKEDAGKSEKAGTTGHSKKAHPAKSATKPHPASATYDKAQPKPDPKMIPPSTVRAGRFAERPEENARQFGIGPKRSHLQETMDAIGKRGALSSEFTRQFYKTKEQLSDLLNAINVDLANLNEMGDTSGLRRNVSRTIGLIEDKMKKFDEIANEDPSLKPLVESGVAELRKDIDKVREKWSEYRTAFKEKAIY